MMNYIFDKTTDDNGLEETYQMVETQIDEFVKAANELLRKNPDSSKVGEMLYMNWLIKRFFPERLQVYFQEKEFDLWYGVDSESDVFKFYTEFKEREAKDSLEFLIKGEILSNLTYSIKRTNVELEIEKSSVSSRKSAKEMVNRLDEFDDLPDLR